MPALTPAAIVTSIAARSTESVARRCGLKRPTAKIRIGAGANSIAKPPAIGIAATARNNAPESAAARINPTIALPVTDASPSLSKYVCSAQGRERKQRDHPRALYRDRQLPLMPRAVARGARGHDLAAFGDEALQRAHILEI